MRRIFLTIAVFAISSCVMNPVMAQTRFKGRFVIEQEIRERLTNSNDFSFDRYLTGMDANDAFTLLQLIGGFSVTVGQSTFQNGQPNAINMLLWNLVLHGLGEEVGRSCLMSVPQNLWNAQFRQALDAICLWPEASAKELVVMHDFWSALTAYDAPEQEFSAWREFFLQSSYATRPGPEAVSAMVLTALLNPNFLLKR